MKITNKYEEIKQEISIKNYLKKNKIQRVNMEEIDVLIFLKKKKKKKNEKKKKNREAN